MPSPDDSSGFWALQFRKLDPGSLKLWAVIGIAFAVGLGLQFAFGEADRHVASLYCALLLAWASVVDARRYILPDMLTYPLVVGGLVWAAATRPADLDHHVIGAAIGFGVFAGMSWGFTRMTGRQGLGLGDAKLLAAAGAWLGWAALPLLVLIASATGLLVALLGALVHRDREASQPVAFGPHLAASFWLIWVFGPLRAWL